MRFIRWLPIKQNTIGLKRDVKKILALYFTFCQHIDQFSKIFAPLKSMVLLTQIAVLLLLLTTGFFIRLLLIRHLRKRMPGKRRKKQLFKQINRWKDLGYNYNKRLKLLINLGYDKSVANILLGEVEYMSKPVRDRKSEESTEEFIN